MFRNYFVAGAAALALCHCATAANAAAKDPDKPWLDTALSADQRVDLLMPRLRQAEKLILVFGYFGENKPDSRYSRPADARFGSAGFIPGIKRLGIPPQWETDAGLGVATQRDSYKLRERTSLPSGLATAATWSPDLAFQGGVMIGSEARKSGFNVMLAGGLNLVRDPRDGRNFEYAGEDPLLAGVMVGQAVRGVESNHLISTVKHYAFNDQETGRFVLDAQIDPAAARESDLLAFEIAIATADPGAVMCAYNRVNARYACDSDWLLNQVLKGDWQYSGYVMSDWGAVHGTSSALAGLDQESAYIFDARPFFQTPLQKALETGRIPGARLDDMVRRILHSMFAKGLVDDAVVEARIDWEADAAVTQADAEEGIVLLRNENGMLPLSSSTKSLAIIGSHADVGVLSGGGSSQVYPVGGMAVPRSGPNTFPRPVVYFPSSPLEAIAARVPAAAVRYADGSDRTAAVQLAAQSEVAIIFAHQWGAETLDPSLSLPDEQDQLIAAVSAAAPHAIVILETGGPVLMPWLERTSAVLQAWYPGTRGGEAIARILFGEVAPSGHLPMTFPKDLSQLPRPELDGTGLEDGAPFSVKYREGAAVGYKWYDKMGLAPLFPFGFGLAYTDFRYEHLKLSVEGDRVTVEFDVSNTGTRAGKAVPQVYVGATGGAWESPRRLAAWSKLALAPGATEHVNLIVPPRLFGTFDAAKGWSRAPGEYQISLAASSRDIRAVASVTLPGASLPLRWTVTPRLDSSETPR